MTPGDVVVNSGSTRPLCLQKRPEGEKDTPLLSWTSEEVLEGNEDHEASTREMRNQDLLRSTCYFIRSFSCRSLPCRVKLRVIIGQTVLFVRHWAESINARFRVILQESEGEDKRRMNDCCPKPDMRRLAVGDHWALKRGWRRGDNRALLHYL